MSPSVQQHHRLDFAGAAGRHVLIFSGGHKLVDLPGTMNMFASMGMPGWLATLIGGAEVLGGIGLLVPRTVRPPAMGLLIIMIGAVLRPATKIPGGLAMVLLLAVVLVLRSRTTAQAV